MADSVVSFLLEYVSQLLAREANLLCGVEDRIRSLRNELDIINVYLKTSEGKNSKSSKREIIEQTVLCQIRDAAHDAEDVIDTFLTNVTIHKRRSMLERMLHGIEHAKLLHDVAQKIDKIKATLNEIRDNRVKYGDFPAECSYQSTWTREEEEEDIRMRSMHRLRRNVEEEDVVGFVHESKEVINRLMEGGSRSRRDVISIVGMGGLGNTTLARKVYNSNEVKNNFNCRAWVYVSNESRASKILLSLLKHWMPNPEYECRRRTNEKRGEEAADGEFSRLRDDVLKEMVRECLESKRYLVVLDDLWKKHDWDEVQDAFPDNNRGSRILITSRLKEVASHTSRDPSRNPPHYLQFLTEEQSWELFSIKVFRGEEYPSDLEPLGRQMVNSCRGLPLAIVVLAGLLANKDKTQREWSKVVDHVKWYLTQDETQVKDIVLKLSYDNLPTRLKLCFLYLGIFPEDSEIHVRQLLERWVAEGFIQETGSRDPDDVAEDYLYELIDRSLIQVARLKDSGGVKTCRIHDLFRDLCISESKEYKFFHVCTVNNILIPSKPRRLSICCRASHYVSSSTNDHSCVRSLFFTGPSCPIDNNKWKCLSKSFTLVRVLDLGNNHFLYDLDRIPSNVGNFTHLRYLRIDSQHLSAIPTSICNLLNLQTLDLGRSFNRSRFLSFPHGIWKLKHLRHVYTYGAIKLHGHHSKSDGEVMWNLQTISHIAFNERIASLIEKGRFPKLKKLGLRILNHRDVPKLLLSLQQLRHLNKLTVDLHTYVSPPFVECKPQEVLQSLEHLSHLTVLKIVNTVDCVACAASFPPNITKLTLLDITCLNDDGVNALGSLTKLQILSLSGGSVDRFDLNCISGGFPQLQVFRMRTLAIQNWRLANGAMPRLQSLSIDRCSDLDGLPSELWSLTALTKVHVRKPSDAMAHMLRNLEMKNNRCELVVDME